MTLEELKSKFTETLQYRVAVLNKDEKYAAMLSEESMQRAGFTDMDTFAFYQISGWVPSSDKTIAEILEDADETTTSRLIKSLNSGSKFMDYNEDGIAREDVEARIGSTNINDLIKYDLDSDGDIDEDDLSTFSTVNVETEEPVATQTNNVNTEEPVATQTNNVNTEEPVATQTNNVNTEEPEATQTNNVNTEEPVATQTNNVNTEEPEATQTNNVDTDVETKYYYYYNDSGICTQGNNIDAIKVYNGSTAKILVEDGGFDYTVFNSLAGKQGPSTADEIKEILSNSDGICFGSETSSNIKNECDRIGLPAFVLPNEIIDDISSINYTNGYNVYSLSTEPTTELVEGSTRHGYFTLTNYVGSMSDMIDPDRGSWGSLTSSVWSSKLSEWKNSNNDHVCIDDGTIGSKKLLLNDSLHVIESYDSYYLGPDITSTSEVESKIGYDYNPDSTSIYLTPINWVNGENVYNAVYIYGLNYHTNVNMTTPAEVETFPGDDYSLLSVTISGQTLGHDAQTNINFTFTE